MKTNQDIAMELAHRTCTKYLHAPDSSSVQYSFSARHLTDFVEKLIAARAIEAEATKPKFHTTELRNPPEAVFSCGEATKPCVCGDSSAQGVFHRNDGPCYITVEEATNPQEPVAKVVHVVIPAGHATEERQSFQVNWLTIDPFKFAGPLYTNSRPCQSCDEKQSAIDVWEGRYADLSAKCAELEDFCISQGNELAKLDEKVFDQDRLLKQQAEKISATLVALAGLPNGALDGGWTYAGMNKYALGLEVKCAELEAERGDLLLRVHQFDHHVSAIGHHIGAVCGGVDVDPEVEGSTAAAIIAKFDEKKERIAELTRIIAGLRADRPQAKPKRASTLPAPRHGPCNYPYWRILEVTA